jgi:hypothetical protein
LKGPLHVRHELAGKGGMHRHRLEPGFRGGEISSPKGGHDLPLPHPQHPLEAGFAGLDAEQVPQGCDTGHAGIGDGLGADASDQLRGKVVETGFEDDTGPVPRFGGEFTRPRHDHNSIRFSRTA